jgi:hypothetical protein
VVYDTLVTARMQCGLDVWGGYEEWKETDMLQSRFSKRKSLNVQRTDPHIEKQVETPARVMFISTGNE